MIALVLGSLLVGMVVLVVSWLALAPGQDAQPFDAAVRLDGSETRLEFTATRSEPYAVTMTVTLPDDATVKHSIYECFLDMQSPDRCGDLNGHFSPYFSIEDTADKHWAWWNCWDHAEFNVSGRTASGMLGDFKPVRGHHYVLRFRTVTVEPKLRSAPARLSASAN